MVTEISYKRYAKASLLAILILVILCYVEILQTDYQLISPLVPSSVVLQINKPIVISGLICSLLSIVGLVLFFYKKYQLVILAAVIAILIHNVLPYLITP